MMRTRLTALLVLLAVLALAAPAPSQPLPSLKLLVPANPGGGWDQTGRAMEQALRAEKLVRGAIRITNRGRRRRHHRARGVRQGQGGGRLAHGDGARDGRRHPHQQVGGDPGRGDADRAAHLGVPRDRGARRPRRSRRSRTSPRPCKKDPGAVSIAGGSRGGSDHILAALIAEAVGVPRSQGELRRVRGRRRGRRLAARRPGGGGHQRLRRVPGAHRVEEAARDRDQRARARARHRRADAQGAGRRTSSSATGAGWWRRRASRGADRKALLDTIDRMAKSARGRTMLKKHNWDDAYLAGDAFAQFIKTETDRIGNVLQERRPREVDRACAGALAVAARWSPRSACSSLVGAFAIARRRAVRGRRPARLSASLIGAGAHARWAWLLAWRSSAGPAAPRSRGSDVDAAGRRRSCGPRLDRGRAWRSRSSSSSRWVPRWRRRSCSRSPRAASARAVSPRDAVHRPRARRGRLRRLRARARRVAARRTLERLA